MRFGALSARRRDGELRMPQRGAVVAPIPRRRASTAWALRRPPGGRPPRRAHVPGRRPPRTSSWSRSGRRASRAGRGRAPIRALPAASRRGRSSSGSTCSLPFTRSLVQIGRLEQTSRPGGVIVSRRERCGALGQQPQPSPVRRARRGVADASRAPSATASLGASRCRDRGGGRARPDPRARRRARGGRARRSSRRVHDEQRGREQRMGEPERSRRRSSTMPRGA